MSTSKTKRASNEIRIIRNCVTNELIESIGFSSFEMPKIFKIKSLEKMMHKNEQNSESKCLNNFNIIQLKSNRKMNLLQKSKMSKLIKIVKLKSPKTHLLENQSGFRFKTKKTTIIL